MPADRLTTNTSLPESAVWRILAGDDLDATAEAYAVNPAELSAAATIYRHAGHEALAAHADGGWQQLYLRFPDWDHAERTAAEQLLPVLTAAEHNDAISSWWFMRKHPCWRLRLLPGPGHAGIAELTATLDQLVVAGHLDTWSPGVYEAETAAFGGPQAIDAAHRLFAADSRAVLELAASGETGLGRRELSVLLCGTLMRDGARLEWYERGDVWDLVAAERPLPSDVAADRIAAMADTLRTLLLADTASDGPLFADGGPAAAQRRWASAFRDTGRSLAEANATGALKRGLRHALSYHVIFHWNRLGLPAKTQSILAHAARHAVLGPTEQPIRRSPAAGRSPDAAPAVRPDATLARFPLIHQGRQHCGDLPSRVALVEEHAANAAAYPDADRRINAAAAAWNLAALIAADCGLPNLAEELAIAQFDLFHQAWPLSGRPAIAALQPLVNLARLAQRTGDPRRAYDVLAQIESAALHGSTVDVAGLTIPFDGFLEPDGDHAPLQAWLRRTMREDGTRALVAARAWDQAAAHGLRYDDLPEQMHESRQMLVIAAAHAGRPDDALALIDSCTTAHPWQQTVAGCLRAFIDTGASDPDMLISDVQAARAAAAGPVMTMFRIRLGLTAARLLAPTRPREAELLLGEAACDAEQSGSAYAARDVLDDADPPLEPPSNSPVLQDLVTEAGLRRGSIPDDLLARLAAATGQAASVITSTLKPLTPTSC